MALGRRGWQVSVSLRNEVYIFKDTSVSAALVPFFFRNVPYDAHDDPVQLGQYFCGILMSAVSFPGLSNATRDEQMCKRVHAEAARLVAAAKARRSITLPVERGEGQLLYVPSQACRAAAARRRHVAGTEVGLQGGHWLQETPNRVILAHSTPVLAGISSRPSVSCCSMRRARL